MSRIIENSKYILNKILVKISPGNDYYWPKRIKLRKFFNDKTKGKLAINLGGRDDGYDKHVLNINISISSDTRVVSDAHYLPFKSESIEGVTITALLEHVKFPWIVATEVERVLKSNGVLYMENPWIYNYHPDPIDCWRFSHESYSYLFPNINFREIKISQGPSTTVTNVLRNYFACFFSRNLMFLFIHTLVGWLFFPLKFLDIFIRDKKYAHIIASGFYCIGTKK